MEARTTVVTDGLLVRIEAKPGREDEVRAFLESGRALVEEEPGTTAWFAIRLGPSTFAIFDVFPDGPAREAHLGGKVAQALTQNVGELFDEPSVERVDVVAAKLPR
jgi:quinol monooxygenase YgiN